MPAPICCCGTTPVQCSQTFLVHGCSGAGLSGVAVSVYDHSGGSLLASGTTGSDGKVLLTWNGSCTVYVTANGPACYNAFGQSFTLTWGATTTISLTIPTGPLYATVAGTTFALNHTSGCSYSGGANITVSGVAQVIQNQFGQSTYDCTNTVTAEVTITVSVSFNPSTCAPTCSLGATDIYCPDCTEGSIGFGSAFAPIPAPYNTILCPCGIVANVPLSGSTAAGAVNLTGTIPSTTSNTCVGFDLPVPGAGSILITS